MPRHEFMLLAAALVLASLFSVQASGLGRYGIPYSASTKDVKAISGTSDFAVALLKNGRVVAFGESADGRIDVPSGLSRVVSVSAGEGVAIALTKAGKVATWGTPSNPSGKTVLPVPKAVKNSHVVAVAAGVNAFAAMTSKDQVVVWSWLVDYVATVKVPKKYSHFKLVSMHLGLSYAATTGNPLLFLHFDNGDVIMCSSISRSGGDFQKVAVNVKKIAVAWGKAILLFKNDSFATRDYSTLFPGSPVMYEVALPKGVVGTAKDVAVSGTYYAILSKSGRIQRWNRQEQPSVIKLQGNAKPSRIVVGDTFVLGL